MASPKISVITVTLNCNHDALITAKSVWCQDYNEYEYIVKDGVSSDGTVETICSAGVANIYVSPDKGIYDAMNQALNYAQGDYVHFLNAGDIYTNPDALKTVAKAINQAGNPAMAICYLRDLSRNLVVTVPDPPTRFYQFRRSFYHQAVFCRRELFYKYGNFNLEFPLKADHDFIYRCLANEKMNPLIIPSLLINYKGGGLSESALSLPRLRRETRILRRTHFSIIERCLFGLALELSLWRLRSKILRSGNNNCVTRIYRRALEKIHT